MTKELIIHIQLKIKATSFGVKYEGKFRIRFKTNQPKVKFIDMLPKVFNSHWSLHSTSCQECVWGTIHYSLYSEVSALVQEFRSTKISKMWWFCKVHRWNPDSFFMGGKEGGIPFDYQKAMLGILGSSWTKVIWVRSCTKEQNWATVIKKAGWIPPS